MRKKKVIVKGSLRTFWCGFCQRSFQVPMAERKIAEKQHRFLHQDKKLKDALEHRLPGSFESSFK